MGSLSFPIAPEDQASAKQERGLLAHRVCRCCWSLDQSSLVSASWNCRSIEIFACATLVWPQSASGLVVLGCCSDAHAIEALPHP